MKKSFFLGGFLAFCIILLSNISFDKKGNGEKLELNWQENLLVRIDENEINYESIVEGEIKDVKLSKKGTLKTYNISKNIYLFFNEIAERKYLDIYINDQLTSIEIAKELENVEISPKGEYILFKVKDNTDYEIFDVKTKERTVLKEDVFHSGNLIKFLEDGRIVFYGVRTEDKVSGIFSYDIEKKSYSLIKEVTGFVNYIEVLKDYEIIFLKTNLLGETELIKLNVKTKVSEKLSIDIENIYDGEYLDGKFYFLGNRFKSNVAIYSCDLGTKDINRVTFDFPENINLKAGIEVIDGEIYFDGYKENLAEGNIYRFNPKDKSVNLVSGKKGEYLILERADKFWNLSAFLCFKK